MTTRHLVYAEPTLAPARMILLDTDPETGNVTEIARYTSTRSFRRIERHDRTYRLAGADRATGELIYLELEEEPAE